MVKNTSWKTISVPIDLVTRVESFVNNDDGKKLGYTSKTGFITNAIREKIDRVSGISKKEKDDIQSELRSLHYVVNDSKALLTRIVKNLESSKTNEKIHDLENTISQKLSLISLDDIQIQIRDTEINHIVTVNTLETFFCDQCDFQSCKHVAFAHSIDKSIKKFKKDVIS